jgi:diguanylate cyclase (GGDEF)-like protein
LEGLAAVAAAPGLVSLYAHFRKRGRDLRSIERRTSQLGAELLIASLDAVPDPIAIVDAREHILAANAAWQLFARENGIDRATGSAGELLHEVLAGRLATGRLEYACHARGEERWFEMTITRLEFDGSSCAAVRHQNVTERVVSRRKLGRKLDALQAIEAGLGALVFHRSRDAQGWQYDFIARSGATLFGFAPSEIYGAAGLNEALVHPDDRERLNASPAQDFRIISGTGETHWVREITRQQAGAARGPGTPSEVGILFDVTSAVRHRELAQNAYKFDPLTLTYSRRYFEEAVDAAFGRCVAERGSFAVAILDIDAFREINEVYGFDTGDELLRQVASELRTGAGSADVVARLGPDTFGILTHLSTKPDADALADALLARFGRHFDIGGHRLYVSISIGVVVSGDAEEKAANILRYADIALERAKSAGGGRCIYSDNLTAETIARAELKDNLREAIAREEFALVYQPKISLRTGEISGCEALIRWNHPARGIQPPNHFIPFAESSGLIVPIGEWVVRDACRQYAAWRDEGFEPVPISVNVSAVQFARSDLPSIVERALRDSGVPPSALRIEITEGVMLDYSHACATVLGTLRDMGIEIELDDFGTGYSSLAYLKSLPISTLKIDRSFVHGALQDPRDAAIVSAIVALAAKLGLTTIGEGAETSAQASFLRDVGCDQVQGYFFSRPLNPEDFARYAALTNRAFAGPAGQTRHAAETPKRALPDKPH